MYEYAFETLYVGGGFWMNNDTYEHRKLIDRYAQEGWRFAGFVPSRFTGNGGIKEIDLVFEKEVGQV